MAIGAALGTIRRLVASLTERSGSASCRDGTGADFKARLGAPRCVLGGGGAWRCFQLAAAWAPEAVRIAAEGPSQAPADPPHPPPAQTQGVPGVPSQDRLGSEARAQ